MKKKKKPSKKLKEIFLQEAKGYLDIICLLLEEDRKADAELLKEIMSALHNLKGSASMMGYNYFSDVAVNFENYLKSYSENAPNYSGIDFSAAAITAMTRMMGNITSGDEDKNENLFIDFKSTWNIARVLNERFERERQKKETKATENLKEETELRAIFISETREKIGNIGYTIYCLTTNPNDEEAQQKLKQQWHELYIETKTVNEIEMAGILEMGTPFTEPAMIIKNAALCAEGLEVVMNAFDEALSGLEKGDKSFENLTLSVASSIEQIEERLKENKKPDAEKGKETAAAPKKSKEKRVAKKTRANKTEQLDPQLLEFFLPEAREYLDEINRLLMKWENNLEDKEIIRSLFRLTHSLKGSAATVGFKSLSKLSHSMEDRFSAIQDGEKKPTRAMMQKLFKDADKLTSTIMEATGIIEIVGEKAEKDIKAEKAGEKVPADKMDALASRTLRVSSRAVDKLFDVTAELVQSHSRLEEMREWLAQLEQDSRRDRQAIRQLIEKIVARFEYSLDKREPQQMAVAAGDEDAVIGGDFGESEFDKYDDVNILARRLDEVGFSVIGTSERMEFMLNEIDYQIEAQGNLIDAAKEKVLDLRMVSLDTVFSRLARPFRDALKEEKKDAELIIKGSENTVDKVIAEAIFDPLVQLIRNSVAHGIESASGRRKAGKSTKGKVTVNAKTIGRRITIAVADDGRGIDPDLIRKILTEKNIIEKNIARTINNEKIIDGIFFPGVSTRSGSNTLAGRGVGLDLVRDAANRFGGDATVRSTVGAGAEFILSLPLTTAIMSVLMVEVSDFQLAVPLDSVVATGRLKISDLIERENQKFYELDGREIPALDFSDMFSKGEKTGLSLISPYILFASGDSKMVFIADELLRIDEVVLRPLGNFFTSLLYFSGAAIGGDGKLRLVLNPSAIMSLVNIKSVSIGDILQRTRVKKVLLVDDSLSIRQVVGGFIQAGGYRVDTALDGQDAWEKLHINRYELIMTDLEMPRMHGYELIDRIMNHHILNKIPVVVISSRSGKKHIDKAMEMGAVSYLTKPANKKQVVALLDEILDSPITK